MTTSRENAGRRMYPSGTEGGSIEGAIAGWEIRRAGGFRDDPERLAQTRLEAKQLKAYFGKYGWTPAEAQTGLAKLSEREAFPRSEEAKVKLRPRTWDQLRIKHGSEEATRAMLANAEKGQNAFAADCLSIAHRAAANGAAEDPDILEIFARHHKPVSEEK